MDELDFYAFGDLIRGFRQRAHMSQTELAEALHLTRGAIGDWEKGNSLPRPERIKEIARVLRLSDQDTAKLVRARLANVSMPLPDAAQSLPSLATKHTVNEQASSDEEIEISGQGIVQQRTGPMALLGRAFQAFLQSLRREPIEAVITSRQREQNRQRMLAKVHAIWIKGFLEKSLYQVAPITLELHELPEAVADPWQLEHQEVDALLEPSFFSSADIERIYDDAGGELLILGQPGSGKTTLLLELARILIARARQDGKQPIPVVLNLSSWSTQGLSLSEWLVKEFAVKYQVPHAIGQDWLRTDQILLLLDGLDEVNPARLGACIDAINAYRQEHGLVPMVICVRSTSYLHTQQTKRIALHRAIMIQPLTKQQVDSYLANAGAQMEAVHATLRTDTELQALISTPLMLSVLRQVYPDTSLKRVQKQGAPDQQHERIFEMYVQRMLQRRRNSTRYTPEETINWLTWLARQLKLHSQSEFYLERMQMDWLPHKWHYRLYPSVMIGLVYGLFFAIIKGVNYAVLQGADQHGRSFGLGRGVVDGLIIGIGNILMFVLLNGLIFSALADQEGNQVRRSWRGNVIHLLGTRPLYGIINGVFNGILITLLVDAPAGIYNGLFIGALYAGIGKLPTEIHPSEVFVWSWTRLQKGLIKFVGGGVFVGLLYGCFTAAYWQVKVLPHALGMSRLLPCLLFGLSVGLVIGLFIALMRGLSHDELDRRDTLRPNQGIWNSMWNGTVLGLSVWIFFGIFFGLVYGVILHRAFQFFGVTYQEYGGFFPRDSGLMIGLTYGLVFAVVVWLSSGGTASMLHLLLRLLLWRRKCIPWNYPRFLDDAAEQLLLRKIGGGYVFMHQTLLSHFADQDTTSLTEQLKISV